MKIMTMQSTKIEGTSATFSTEQPEFTSYFGR
jgi:hypothetical protein